MDIESTIVPSGSAWLGALLAVGIIVLAYVVAIVFGLLVATGPGDVTDPLLISIAVAPLPPLLIAGVLLVRRGRTRTVAGLAIGTLLFVVMLAVVAGWLLSDFHLGA